MNQNSAANPLDGHRQRLRDRFQEKGIDALSDVKVIELLLTFGTPRLNCKQPARAGCRF